MRGGVLGLTGGDWRFVGKMGKNAAYYHTSVVLLASPKLILSPPNDVCLLHDYQD